MECEKRELQKLLDDALKAQEDLGTHKRSRADADGPAMGESAKIDEHAPRASWLRPRQIN